MKARLSIDRLIRNWRTHRADRALFERLCVAQGLDAEDREVLIHLADHHGLVRMSQIFLRPSLFRASLGAGGVSTERMTRLHERLFAETSERESSAANPAVADAAFPPSS